MFAVIVPSVQTGCKRSLHNATLIKGVRAVCAKMQSKIQLTGGFNSLSSSNKVDVFNI